MANGQYLRSSTEQESSKDFPLLVEAWGLAVPPPPRTPVHLFSWEKPSAAPAVFLLQNGSQRVSVKSPPRLTTGCTTAPRVPALSTAPLWLINARMASPLLEPPFFSVRQENSPRESGASPLLNAEVTLSCLRPAASSLSSKYLFLTSSMNPQMR